MEIIKPIMTNDRGGKREGAGRKKSASPMRNRLMQSYTDSQLMQIKALAATSGLTVTQYIRKQATRGEV